MSEWVRLGDITSIRKGTKLTESPRTNNSVRQIQIEDLRSDENIKWCEKSDKQVSVSENDLIIAWDGANAGTVGFGLNGVIGSTLAKISFQIPILSKYAGVFLQSKFHYLQEKSTGSTIPHVSRSALDNIRIPIPSNEEQQHIVSVLDTVNSLIDARKKQIALLDEAEKSLFVEMFGDPIENPKGWDKNVLSSIAKLMGGFAFKSGDFTETGIKVVKITNVHKDYLTWDDITYLPETYLKKYSAYSLSDGDIVLALTRPIILSLAAVKMAIVQKNDLPCLLNQRVGKFIINTALIEKEFLIGFCKTDYFKHEIEKFCRVALQPNVSCSEVESINCYIPPLSLQKEFAARISSIEERRREMEAGLQQMEEARSALMQQYFG